MAYVEARRLPPPISGSVIAGWLLVLVHEVRHGHRKNYQRTLDALQAGAVTGFLWDEELKGPGWRSARAAQRPTSSNIAWAAARRRYVATIRGHGSPWTPFTAREEATRLLRLVDQGIDPVAADKQRRREAVDLAFSNYADRFAGSCKGKGWSTLVRDRCTCTLSRFWGIRPYPRWPASKSWPSSIECRVSRPPILAKSSLCWGGSFAGPWAVAISTEVPRRGWRHRKRSNLASAG